MPLINCEINLILEQVCYANCIISNTPTIQATAFSINDTKLYVLVATI